MLGNGLWQSYFNNTTLFLSHSWNVGKAWAHIESENFLVHSKTASSAYPEAKTTTQITMPPPPWNSGNSCYYVFMPLALSDGETSLISLILGYQLMLFLHEGLKISPSLSALLPMRETDWPSHLAGHPTVINVPTLSLLKDVQRRTSVLTKIGINRSGFFMIQKTAIGALPFVLHVFCFLELEHVLVDFIDWFPLSHNDPYLCKLASPIWKHLWVVKGERHTIKADRFLPFS